MKQLYLDRSRSYGLKVRAINSRACTSRGPEYKRDEARDTDKTRGRTSAKERLAGLDKPLINVYTVTDLLVHRKYALVYSTLDRRSPTSLRQRRETDPGQFCPMKKVQASLDILLKKS